MLLDYEKERWFAVTDAKQRPGFQTAAALITRLGWIEQSLARLECTSPDGAADPP